MNSYINIGERMYDLKSKKNVFGELIFLLNKNHNEYNSSKRRSLAKRKSNNSPFSFDYVKKCCGWVLCTSTFLND